MATNLHGARSVDDLVGPLPSFPRSDTIAVTVDSRGTRSGPAGRSVLQDLGSAKLFYGVLASSLGRLQCGPDVLLLALSRRGRRSEVRPDKEPGEEVGKGSEVDDVEPDGKGLRAGVETRHPGVVLEPHGRLDGRGGEFVVDKEVKQGRSTTDDELGDLSRSQRSLERFGHADVERGDGVVGVLQEGRNASMIRILSPG